MNCIKKTSLSICSLLLAGSIFSQTTTTPPIAHSKPGINISLWKNISTQHDDTTRNTIFNLGLYSSINRLNGLGINILGTTIRQEANGMAVSGIFNVAQGNARGLQLAGITNINGNDFSGISVSGLVNLTSYQMKGLLLSGLTNITGNYSRGAVLGGLLNFCGEEAAGFHLAGLADISNTDFSGASLSGFINVAGNNLHGLQIAGITSIAANHMTGVQISGLGNIAGGKVCGLQLSPINIATDAKGLQIGVVNYYKNNFDGLQLGLVNANPHTRIQLMLFGGNTSKLNMGIRFKNQLFYTILGGGTHYLDFSDKFSASCFYRAGLSLPLCQRFSISGDLGYQHIETFKNESSTVPARLYALQARINLEYNVTERFGIFCTGGYGISRPYTQNRNFDKGLIWEGGIILF